MFQLEWYECLARLAEKCSLQPVDAIKTLSDKERIGQELHFKYEAIVQYLAKKLLDASYLDNNPLPTKTIFQEEEHSLLATEEDEEDEDLDDFELEGLLGPQRNSIGQILLRSRVSTFLKK